MRTKEIDLTTGDCSRQLLALSLPLLIGNIFQQLYNTIDSYIAGNYIDANAFAALGIAGTMMNLYIFIINGCCNGISIVFAQVYGKKDTRQMKQEAFLSLSFGFVFTTLLSILGFLLLKPLLDLIATPQSLRAYIISYLSIILLFLFVTFLYNWFSCILRALGDANASMYSLFVSILFNILLDLVFVCLFSWGVLGLAIATILAQATSCIFCFLYIQKHHPTVFFTRKEMVYDASLLTRTIHLGCVSALHQSSLYIGKLCIQGAVNSAGMECITAYSITNRIEGFINSFGDSGCTAVSIMVGQSIGAGNGKRVKEVLQCSLCWMSAFCMFLSIAMVLLTKPFVMFFMEDASEMILSLTFSYMLVIAFFYIFCFIGNCFVGLYKGLGLVHIPVLGTILHISIRVFLTYAFIDQMQLSAVALASGIGWICVVLYQTILYQHIRKTI